MRVLLATDGSKDARAAAEFLRDFPLPETAEILVLTVVDLPATSLDVDCTHDVSSPTAHGLAKVLSDMVARGVVDEIGSLVPDYCRAPDAKVPSVEPSARRPADPDPT